MPLGEAIVGEAVVAAIVAEFIEKTGAHFGSLGVAMNVAEGIQGPIPISGRKAIGKVALFPKMPRPVQHSVKTHRRVPVEKLHDFRQIFRLRGFD